MSDEEWVKPDWFDPANAESWRQLAELSRKRAERAEVELQHMREREAHFARVLGVADGGRYRNDWDAAIERVVAERDDYRSSLLWITSVWATEDEYKWVARNSLERHEAVEQR